MNILVTGAKGFVGKNLCAALKNIRDGKDKTRPNIKIDEIFEYDIDSTVAALDEYSSKADFIFMGNVKENDDTIEKYTDKLEYAASLGLDFLCVGNDVATYKNGEICLGSGAVAEQYALLGGRVITLGKPNELVLQYAKECFSANLSNILFVGDSFSTDMKSANILNADMVLISKGIHVNFLGEGYIPDIEKTRNMAQDYEIYPDYVMSGLRW